MALTREKKEAVVREVGEILENESIVFVSFTGISVAEIDEIRRGFRDQGVGYRVVKKSLLDRALGKRSVDGDKPSLEGEIAIAYGADAILPAKVIAEQQKKTENRIVPLGGIFEGVYIRAEQVARLAATPSRDVLYGQFVTIINAPVQQTVQALNGIPSSFVSVLDQIAQQKA